MKNFQSYIHRQKTEFQLQQLPEKLPAQMVIIIPCYNESQLIRTLNSIMNCKKGKWSVAVAVIINSSEKSPSEVVEFNKITNNLVNDYAQCYNSDFLTFHSFLFDNLPKKHAGVGLARKIGMDLAIEHFFRNNIEDGVIASLDADCMVSINYLTGIEKAYKSDAKVGCCVHNFRHFTEDYNSHLSSAIEQYEKHIRYFSAVLKKIDFPYYYHTIGSAFSVRARTYVGIGGMGRQQGGEDFYFLQKAFEHGKTVYLEDVYVYPEARFSERIPFGTGPALQKIIDHPEEKLETYSLDSFFALEELLKLRKIVFKKNTHYIQHKIDELPQAIKQYCQQTDFISKIEEANSNCATQTSFDKRFFHHFNAFHIIKYLNAVHPAFYPYDYIVDAFEKLKLMD